MGKQHSVGIYRPTFERIAREYRRQWRIEVYATRPDGRLVFGNPRCGDKHSSACTAIRAHAIKESLRWGEPSIELCPNRRLLWAVPLMVNAELRGGLVASTREKRVFPSDAPNPALDLRKAAASLRRLAETENVTNAALLAARRTAHFHEQKRAEAIHEWKEGGHYDLRVAYLREEPALVAAIRKGDRHAARAILNRLLVAVHHRAQERFDLLKSFFMELVAILCRTAVEAGGDPDALLGENYANIAALAAMDTPEEITPWLKHMLERILDAIQEHRRESNDVLLHAALEFMRENYMENITRDEAAKAAHLSSAHFSRLFKREIGRSFTEVLNQMRVDRAAEMLVRTDKPLSVIAMDAGFSDQSYFTKVFRRYNRITPLQYRKQNRSRR